MPDRRDRRKYKGCAKRTDQRGKQKTRVHGALQTQSSKAQFRQPPSTKSIHYLSSGVIDSTGAGTSSHVAALAIERGQSADFTGYWQRHIAG
jgi:hypothetical protein